MKITKIKRFIKSYKKLPKKVQTKFDLKLFEFMKDPFTRELNNHALIWDYLWYRSINVTGDYRAIFKEYPNWSYEFVDFIDIGTHSQLYG